MEEAKANMDSAVAVVGSSSANPVQTVPNVQTRKWVGGRPKKSSGSLRGKYNTLTGQQRLWMVTFIEDQISQPGNSLKQAKVKAQLRLKCSDQTVRIVWNDKVYGKAGERRQSGQVPSDQAPGRKKARGSPTEISSPVQGVAK